MQGQVRLSFCALSFNMPHKLVQGLRKQAEGDIRFLEAWGAWCNWKLLPLVGRLGRRTFTCGSLSPWLDASGEEPSYAVSVARAARGSVSKPIALDKELEMRSKLHHVLLPRVKLWPLSKFLTWAAATVRYRKQSSCWKS